MDASQTVWANRTMIVTASDAPLARELCAGLAGESSANMFTTALSADGLEPATHYISAGWISQAFADLLPLTTFDAEGVPTTTPGNPAEIVALAKEAGMSVTLTKVTGLLKRSDVTDGEPLPRMAQLGLQLINPEPVSA